MKTTTEKTLQRSKNSKKAELICECCGRLFPRWDIDMVERTIHSHIYDFSLGDFTFACPECIQEHELKRSQSDMAEKFRSVNEELRQVVSPLSVIH